MFFLRLILECFLLFSLCQRQTLSPRKQNETIYAPSPDMRDILENKVVWLSWLEMSWITSHGGEAPDHIFHCSQGLEDVQMRLVPCLFALPVASLA